jgi:hypothetical protein
VRGEGFVSKNDAIRAAQPGGESGESQLNLIELGRGDGLEIEWAVRNIPGGAELGDLGVEVQGDR